MRKTNIRDLQASFEGSSSIQPGVRIKDSTEWHEWIAAKRVAELPLSEVIGLVLCGGRSTRMGSTIPKPVFPFGPNLMLNGLVQRLRHSLGGKKSDLYAAIGFRSRLIERAFGSTVKFLEYKETLGVGFRVATCLEELRGHEGPVVLAYVDTPKLPSAGIRDLLTTIRSAPDAAHTLGILTALAPAHVSGHVRRDGDRRIIGIAQDRTEKENVRSHDDRDAGLYVFHNTEEFRRCLLEVSNNNLRGEYIFADVVSILAQRGWSIVERKVSPAEAIGVNSASDLLYAVSDLHSDIAPSAADVRERFQASYGLEIDPSLDDRDALGMLLRQHTGPLYFFHWWDGEWSKA